jgi:hypothetical protein
MKASNAFLVMFLILFQSEPYTITNIIDTELNQSCSKTEPKLNRYRQIRQMNGGTVRDVLALRGTKSVL